MASEAGKSMSELYEEINQDLHMEKTIDYVQNKITELPKIYMKYKAMYLAQRKKLKTIELKINKQKEIQYKYIKFDYDYKIDKSQDVNMLMDAQDPMIKLYMELDRQEGLVELLKDTCDIIMKMSYQIRNYVELEKLRNGTT